MTATSGFGLEGVEQVLANLDRVVKKIEAGAEKARDDQADKLVADIQAGTPRVSGAAAGSVVKGDVAADEIEITAGGRDAPYFPLIEFGGSHNRQPTAPFRRALEVRRLKLVPETVKTIRDDVPELER